MIAYARTHASDWTAGPFQLVFAQLAQMLPAHMSGQTSVSRRPAIHQIAFQRVHCLKEFSLYIFTPPLCTCT